MALEIERAYAVDPAQLPSLDGVPYKDITQIYLSPWPAHSAYPEVAHGEWRVRQIDKPGEDTRYVTTVKFGDKASGSRTEIETELEPGDFGTAKAHADEHGYGIIRKRRFTFPDGLVLDNFNPSLHGNKWSAEREFSNEHEADSWQPPEWLNGSSQAPSNRELASPLWRSRETADKTPLDKVADTVANLRRRYGRVLVTISGMSGSGKSTIAEAIAGELDADLIETDHFHIGKAAMLEHFGIENYDLPGIYDYAHAARAAGQLLIGEAVHAPVYSFVTCEREEAPQLIEPSGSGIIVLDGLYAWHAAREAKRLGIDTVIYNLLVNTPLHVNVLRRLLRDAKKSDVGPEPTDTIGQRAISWSAEDSLRYLMKTAIPTYLEHQQDPTQFDAIV